MKPGFEEKEYEQAANAELARGLGPPRVFSSGQVLENILGYDAAADVHSDHIIWEVLRVPRPPGVVLLPKHWPGHDAKLAGRLPSAFVSLILQYKRPEYMKGAAAAQWKYWHSAYFRFKITPQQQTTLERLESGFGESAVVRYASPTFSQFADLEVAQLSETVLQSTGFVSPSKLSGRHYWTYQKPGTDGRANVGGVRALFESSVNLFSNRLAPAVENVGTELAARTELAGAAETLQFRRPRLRTAVDLWIATVGRRAPELSTEALSRLRSYALVQSSVAEAGATWLLLA